MPKALLAIAHGNDALGVAVPGEIVDPTVHNAVLALSYALADTVPDPDDTTCITAGDVEPGRREPGDGCWALVFCVLSAY